MIELRHCTASFAFQLSKVTSQADYSMIPRLTSSSSPNIGFNFLLHVKYLFPSCVKDPTKKTFLRKERKAFLAVLLKSQNKKGLLNYFFRKTDNLFQKVLPTSTTNLSGKECYASRWSAAGKILIQFRHCKKYPRPQLCCLVCLKFNLSPASVTGSGKVAQLMCYFGQSWPKSC